MPENKPMNVEHKETGTITDVCSREELPEVELVSLIEDQIPQYRLRADSLYLYQNKDWDQSLDSSSHASDMLSPTQAEEAFRYMILSSDRVEQMTRTYNDIDMVTHLLAERDRDLELAARIGQSLLQRNRVLTERSELLEEQLAQAYDQVNQLQHELTKKDELLRFVAIASEESESDSSCSTPLRQNESLSLSHSLIQLDSLQSKLRVLEEENLCLRSEACHLKTETINYEEKEQQLVNDCVKELRETNIHISDLADELSRKNEDIARHQEEITNLLSQIVDLQRKVKEHAIEKEELKLHLQASKDAQRQLTAELHEVQDRNAECLGMLHESQEELKELRSKSTSLSSLRWPQSYSIFPMDSLAAEIEGTMRKELSLEDSPVEDHRNQQKRVFNIVKSVNETVRARAPGCPLGSIPGSGCASAFLTAKPHQCVVGQTGTRSRNSSGSEADLHCNLPRFGQPGTPGGNDLATALRRLSLREENYLSEKRFFEDEQDRRLKALAEKQERSGCSTPVESILSGSTNHTDLSEMSCFSGTSSCFRTFFPEKLQIVKPIEGSMTLYQWQQLAQPNLGTILDPRPGVLTKGFELVPEDEGYHLSDLEEDDEEGIIFKAQQTSTPEEKKMQIPKEMEPAAAPFLPMPNLSTHNTPPGELCCGLLKGLEMNSHLHTEPQNVLSPGFIHSNGVHNPGKCLSQTNSTYTFTTCRILHPTDLSQVTMSSMYTPCTVTSGSTSSVIVSTAPSSPLVTCRLSLGESFMKNRESTTTLSTTSSLAKLLHERGISASVYRCPLSKQPRTVTRPKTLALPCTPPNSPVHSPCPSPLAFDTRGAMDSFLASRPAETLLQEVYCLKLGRSRADSTPGCLNLVKKLKKMGIAQVVNPHKTLEQSEESRSGLHRQETALFMGTGSSLMGGLRRNQSLPNVIGGLGVVVPKMARLNEKTENKMVSSAQ
uniref:Trafficking kinesin protein 2 n=1 Tax=Callorhinchus milii TaxID=7868 RepID=A0A4W3HTE2_CALMI|eukprot:gi/632947087/ref/XP_007888881.1/ PREDICTED: trafficking kinesin-binding protein 2 isoform X2 [Callorhinchus milii]